ncbi:MAG TPA: S41 family peptidase [Cyclobacteriaceae bacterium]|nr:S41 family peptidase [Cyclobacteriaceae bacterium]
MNEPNNSKYQIRLPLILCIGLAGGVLIGASINSKTATDDIGGDVQKFREVLSLIKTEYVDETKTDELVDDAISHMLAKLDPHSAYIPAREREEANEDLRGNFEGIGIEFNIFQDTLVVVAALSGGPSEAVGVRTGDRIVKVDGENIAGIGLRNSEVTKRLKGPKGTEVKIEVVRANVEEPIQFSIIRDKIPQFSVDASYMIDSEIGYIKVSRFSQTTYSEFRQAMDKLKEEGMKKLILDLQGNPGGYMNQAIDLADDFLPAGEKIVFTNGKDTRYNSDALSTNRGEFEKGDLIVLINEGSASASEIVAGALQDNDRALIVGRRSYGKGLVQSPFDLDDGSELRLTISRYYTPSGRSIQKPYGDGQEYARDIMKRYKHGEFFHADSIKFNDSLKYLTLNGRTVYGGGGIMPDYFVPLDTTLNSPYLNALFNSNSFQEYAFNYALENKENLEKMEFHEFQHNFKVSRSMYNDLAKVGERNNVKPDLADLEKNKAVFETFLKANIARRIWGSESFYPIFNETNEILQQAIQLFDRVPDRAKM